MASAVMTITNAGYNAIVNSSANGTSATTITHVALGRGSYTPSKTQEALQDEIVRLDTISGDVMSEDTIHVTAQDEGNDEYQVFEVGLILGDGTLFGVYSQSDAILSKSSFAVALLAIDVRFDDIDANSISFGDTSFILPPATTSRRGVIEIATQDEADDRRADDLALTPETGGKMLADHEQADSAHGADQVTIEGISFGNYSTVQEVLQALGSAAGLDAGTGDGDVVRVGGFGLGRGGINLDSSDDLYDLPPHNAFYAVTGSKPRNSPSDSNSYFELIYLSRGNDANCAMIIVDSYGDIYYNASSAYRWAGWRKSVDSSRVIRAGDGLSGGGSLSGDRTLSVDETVLRDDDIGTSAGQVLTSGDALGLGTTSAVDVSGSIDNITQTMINVRSSTGTLMHLERSGTPSAFQLKMEGNADPAIMFRRRTGGSWTDNERLITDRTIPYGYKNMVVYDASSATFNVPQALQDGYYKAHVRVYGGGGGGAKDDGGAGGGGGQGGYAEGLVDLSGVSSVTCRAGYGGDGGSISSGAVRGSNGSSSSFGNYLSATGGQGGNIASGSSGGSGSGGDFRSNGAPGGSGFDINGAKFSGAGGGPGGGSSRFTTGNQNGDNGAGLMGAGGAGGNGTGVGGRGAQGCVIICW